MGRSALHVLPSLLTILAFLGAQSAAAADSASPLAVVNPLQFTISSLPNGNVNSIYFQVLSASGGVTPYVWSLVSGVLPSGVSLNQTNGQLSGDPTQTGTFSFTIGLSDSGGTNISQAFVVGIASGCPFSLNPTSASPAATGGTASVSVTGPAGCFFDASSNSDFLTITGRNGGSVFYAVAANTASSPRSGSLTIAGQTFVVNQAAALPPSAVSVSPASGVGSSQGFSFQVSDPGGHANVSMVQVVINSGLTGYNACYFVYEPSNNSVFLYDDSSQTFLHTSSSNFQPLQNNQCTLTSGGPNGVFGNALAVYFNITFNPAFDGMKNIYLQAVGVSGLTSGFVLEGTWNVSHAAPPSAVSVSPVSGNSNLGVSQSFTFLFSDPAGFANLGMGQVVFNDTLNGFNACYFLYEPASNNVYLYNDATATYLQTSLTNFQPIQNNKCILSSGSALSGGNNISLTLSITFKGGGGMNVYMQAVDSIGLVSGFILKGSWFTAAIAPSPSLTPTTGSGSSGTFAFKFSDLTGYSNILMGQVLINSTRNGYNACYFVYEPSNNNVFLYDDASGNFLPAPLGSLPVENNQCTLASGSVSFSGNSYTLILSITFKPAFRGVKSIYMQGVDVAGPISGYVTMGTWVVP